MTRTGRPRPTSRVGRSESQTSEEGYSTENRAASSAVSSSGGRGSAGVPSPASSEPSKSYMDPPLGCGGSKSRTCSRSVEAAGMESWSRPDGLRHERPRRARVLQLSADGVEQRGPAERLDEVVDNAGGARRGEVVRLAERGGHDDRNGGRGRVDLERTQDLESGHPRHHPVQEHQVWLDLTTQLERFFACLERAYVEALELEHE